jgi:hypothetical protein
VASKAERAADSGWVEGLARVGLVAQGISFGLVGVLAIMLALGEGGKATDREGALRTIARDGVGQWAVIGLAVGFGCYAFWRLVQVGLGHDVEEPGAREKWSKRATSLGKAAIYGVLCAAAISILRGESGSGNEEKQATEGVLGWPGGPWIVGGVAAALAAAAVWNFYRAVSGQYKKSLKEYEMAEGERAATTAIAFVGLMARAVVFSVAAWFFFNAATEHDPKEAKGLDGALRELAAAQYGKWLLAIVAAGLFAYGVFCVIQARYREV